MRWSRLPVTGGHPEIFNTCNLGTPSEIWARWRRKEMHSARGRCESVDAPAPGPRRRPPVARGAEPHPEREDRRVRSDCLRIRRDQQRRAHRGPGRGGGDGERDYERSIATSPSRSRWGAARRNARRLSRRCGGWPGARQAITSRRWWSLRTCWSTTSAAARSSAGSCSSPTFERVRSRR